MFLLWGHANRLYIVPILVHTLPKRAQGIYVLMCGVWDSLASSELQEKTVSFSHCSS